MIGKHFSETGLLRVRMGTRLWILLILLAPLTGGCGPDDPETWVTYLSSGSFERYDEVEILPIGSQIELQYFREGSEGKGFPLRLEWVRSSAPHVIRVVEYSRAEPPYTPTLGQGIIVLEAVSPGKATIEMKGSSHSDIFSGGTLSIEIEVAKPAKLTFVKGRCLQGDAILPGQPLRIAYDLFDGRDRALYEHDTGRFYRFEPEDAVGTGGFGYMAIRPAHVTVRSRVDDSTIGFQIHPESSITSASLAATRDTDRFLIGNSNYLAITANVLGKSACSHINTNVVSNTVTNLTPTVCAHVKASGSQFRVDFQQPGQCKIDFALPNARGGEGITLRYEAEVESTHHDGNTN
ncbi:hypothetical protein FIV42_05480 [Persicimonas caeni]|uniref:Uncharacterized protein n=1 Tax=Persicimonas caeni TaxID=2292766 RepID=A0A4Y6PQ15_PERCE|nr:hypothetical protein [Persicimonas caeni]QDG50199.1 hypothetical protein FIV42_05480 [Persicimonas caeni]QED31420.1 hypothetical protein FRD00_05475 [Persicimonas caeni]